MSDFAQSQRRVAALEEALRVVNMDMVAGFETDKIEKWVASEQPQPQAASPAVSEDVDE